MRISLADRKRFLASLPWITVLDDMPRLGKNLPMCQGIKWGKVALSDIYNHGPKGQTPPRGIQDRAKCKHRAHWRFKAKGSRSKYAWPAKSGDYCWFHLVQQSYNKVEQARWDAAWEDWKTKEGIS